jgi:hypothetical protein
VNLTLDGFEPAHIPVSRARGIVLEVAHATESTTVVASVLTSSGAAMETLGSRMTAQLANRLPEPRPRILQSLPLLPSVVRGPDGLLRIGGTRPHESSLWVDGFDVTDPVTLTSAIDLPNESVKGMAVLREPTAATFSGTLGSLASIETAPGGDKFMGGVQGFIPRPRLSSNYGLGRIEAFFPRAYAGGKWKQLHFFGSTEFNFERVPVPGVTDRTGSPSSGLTGTSSFFRVDVPLSPTNMLTFEGIVAPSHAFAVGLSPLTELAAAPDILNRDLFGGIVDHIVLGPSTLLTLRAGFGQHRTEVQSSSRDTAIWKPDGWHQNFFAEVQDTGLRRAGSATLDRSGLNAAGEHAVVLDGPPRANDVGIDRDASDSDQDDLDRTMRFIVRRMPASPRQARTTRQRASASGICGRQRRACSWISISAPIFRRTSRPRCRRGLPPATRSTTRRRRPSKAASAGSSAACRSARSGSISSDPAWTCRFNPHSAEAISTHLSLGMLKLPQADMISIEVEHRILPALELQVAFRRRTGFDLPTVEVSPLGGEASLTSTGESKVLKQFKAGSADIAFVPTGNIAIVPHMNDGAAYESRPPLSTGDERRLVSAPYSWATFQFPNEIVVSPAVEWRTGFPYSVFDLYRHYINGEANTERFPNYFSLDITAFKTFDIFNRKWDLGLQFFNVTGHFNPRDVIAVVGSPQYGTFTNSFGITLGGYMRVRW